MPKLGKHAGAYVAARGYRWIEDGPVMVPDDEQTPRGVARTLTRVYGAPTSADRCEVAFWAIEDD
jgi:hypothetical protein